MYTNSDKKNVHNLPSAQPNRYIHLHHLVRGIGRLRWASRNILLLCATIFFLVVLQILFHHAFSLLLPFFAVDLRIIQEFITLNTKDTTCKELLGQGNDVKIKEANFSLMPPNRRILLQMTSLVRFVHFLEEKDKKKVV